MKKILFTLFAILLTTNTYAQTAVQEAVGNYSGKLAVSLTTKDDLTFGEDTYNVAITNDGSNTVTFALNNFGFSGMNLGNIVLPNIPVSKQADGTIHFGANAPVNFTFLGGVITATAKINETTSVINGDSLLVDVDVVWTNGGNAPIYVQFKGKKPHKTTGIQQTITKTADKAIYDIQGRRLHKTNTKGLLIVNGKKVIR